MVTNLPDVSQTNQTIADSRQRYLSAADIRSIVLGFIEQLKCGRATVFKYLLAGACVGLFFSFGSSTEYSSSTRILPYRSGPGASSISGLASLAGVRIPAGLSEASIQPELYPELVNTIDFQIEVAETPLHFGTLGVTRSSIAYFDSLYARSPVELLAHYTVGLPGLMRRSLIKSESGATLHTDPSGPPAYSLDYLETLSAVRQRVKISLNARSGVISVSATMPDPVAAADLVAAVSDVLRDRITRQESQKAEAQVRFIEGQAGEARLRLDSAQNALASFMSRNRAVLSPLLEVEADRLRNDRDFAFQIHQQLSTELEQARIKMHQDTPVFATLETPSVPPVRSSPQRTRLLLGCTLGGALVGLVVVLLRNWWRSAARDSVS